MVTSSTIFLFVAQLEHLVLRLYIITAYYIALRFHFSIQPYDEQCVYSCTRVLGNVASKIKYLCTVQQALRVITVVTDVHIVLNGLLILACPT